MPPTDRRACLVVHHFNSEPAVPSVCSRSRAGLPVCNTSARSSRPGGSDPEFSGFHSRRYRAPETQAVESHADRGPPGLLAHEYRGQYVSQGLQVRYAFFHGTIRGFIPSARISILCKPPHSIFWVVHGFSDALHVHNSRFARLLPATFLESGFESRGWILSVALPYLCRDSERGFPVSRLSR